MNENYDAIVLGTGLTECVISGLLSVNGMKVLHMDRNNYYGGASASLQLDQLYRKFRGEDKPPQQLGASRDYNVDLIPKFLMANGKLVKILRATGVSRYNMEFMLVDGSYVFKKPNIYKVPATDVEALKSPLMGIFEKRRCRKFLLYVQEYKEEDSKTYQGYNLRTMTMMNLFKEFGLSDDTIDFIGHAIANHLNDSYLNAPALDTVKRIQLYEESLRMYTKSPYVYPLYGLGELPQVFARLSAVHGGTYMLDKPVDKILYDDQGQAIGVESQGEQAHAKFVVADPSYFPEKVKKSGNVIRCICVLNHPIENTDNSKSTQIIMPQKQTGRQSDIYILMVSYTHKVAPNGKYIAIVSTTQETNNDPMSEIAPGLKLLEPIQETFMSVDPYFEPVADGTQDKVFISKSYDATTHFETVADDILSLYHRITGQHFDWTKVPDEDKNNN